MALSMVNLAKTGKVDYIFLVAGDPEYVPAIRAAQAEGVLIRLLFPDNLDDRQLEVHPDLLKAVDERVGLTKSQLEEFEYINEYEEYEDEYEDVDYEDYDDDLDLDEPLEEEYTEFEDDEELEDEEEESE